MSTISRITKSYICIYTYTCAHTYTEVPGEITKNKQANKQTEKTIHTKSKTIKTHLKTVNKSKWNLKKFSNPQEGRGKKPKNQRNEKQNKQKNNNNKKMKWQT